MLRCRPVLAAARLGRNRPGWSGSGRGPVAGPCCGSSGPRRPAGRSDRRAPVRCGGGSCGAGWRSCGGGLPGSLELCDGCWSPAACGPGPVGRWPVWRRRPARSPGWAHCSPSEVVAKLAIPTSMTDCGLGGLQGPGRHLVTGQDQHPAAPFAADLDGLDPALDLAVDGDLHVSDPLQVDPAGVGLPAAAVAVLGPFHAVEAVRRLEPRIAGRLAGLDPPEEPGEGPVQTAQRRLLGRERPRRHIRPDLPDLLELSRLLPVGDSESCSAATRPVVPAGRRCTARGARPGIAPRRHAGERWAAAGT